ncbi:MAG: NAD(P)H-hydrate dehydratase [Bacteroidales bacterium]|nr:NAD(P)H-hydrate dehydratase [Bacteroidales bacterium]
MKIPTIQQIREADAYTITNEPIESIQLMERAANVAASKIMELFPSDISMLIFCGMGNNGGDGLAIARILLQHNYTCQVYIVKHTETFSEDCQKNLAYLQSTHPLHIHEIIQENDIPSLHVELIIDAVLGSGLNKPVDNSLLSKLFHYINHSNAFVFSIDIPSGFFADKSMPKDALAIHADFVFTFQFPKLAFLFPESYPFVGEWEVGDINLHPDFINKIESPYYYIEEQDIQGIHKPRPKFSHKGNYGRALLIAGSKGMMGAAVLASKACLRSGVGILETHVPEIGYQIIQTAVPEALCTSDQNTTHFTAVDLEKLTKANAIAIGPGLGMHPDTILGIKNVIKHTRNPIIFDADAINCLAENKTYLEFLPPYCIFTPHPKEFERLVGKAANSFHRLNLQREFSNKYQCIVVLKGAHTSISIPNGNVYFNSTGNPGMAKAGSGDVLTGMLLALLAQHYSPIEATIMAVFNHGKAADMVAKKISYESMIASDIIDEIKEIYY